MPPSAVAAHPKASDAQVAVQTFGGHQKAHVSQHVAKVTPVDEEDRLVKNENNKGTGRNVTSLLGSLIGHVEDGLAKVEGGLGLKVFRGTRSIFIKAIQCECPLF